MAVPDPATTNWVPIWNPMGAGPAGPAGPAITAPWLDVAYDAANFGASAGMVWTVDAGDVSAYAYSLIDHTMFLAFNFQTTSISGTLGPSVTFKIPGGKVAAKNMEFIGVVVSNGVQGTIRIFTFAGNGNIFCNHSAGNWPASTNATVVSGQITFPIQ